MGDNEHRRSRQDDVRAHRFEISNVLSNREANAIDNRLEKLNMEPIQGSTEARIAVLAWKTHDAGAAHALLTTLLALTALGVALIAKLDVSAWALIAFGILLAIATNSVLIDKRNWEPVKAVVEHRTAQTPAAEEAPPKTQSD